MFLVCGAFVDPLLEEIYFFGGEGFVHFDGGHALVDVFVGDALDEEAGVGVAGDDGGMTFWIEFRCLGETVEAEVGFTGGDVGAVTAEAVVGNDGADLAIEIDARFC